MKNQLVTSLLTVLVRDLKKLEAEILLYPSEESIWKIEKDIKNPAGTLCLHLCGNLQHYIGSVLGKTAYKRNRDNEFASRNVPRESLLTEITQSINAIEATLPLLTEEQLLSTYPVKVFDNPTSTLFFLVHLSAHLSYHLSQVNYHRRLVA